MSDEQGPILGTKQMWDSEKGEWVPFELWGAHFIINHRKEYLILRIYHELCPPIKGWKSINSSYLNDQLKEDKSDIEKNTPYKSFAGYQDFKEMIRQDRQEYQNEGRIMEIMK